MALLSLTTDAEWRAAYVLGGKTSTWGDWYVKPWGWTYVADPLGQRGTVARAEIRTGQTTLGGERAQRALPPGAFDDVGGCIPGKETWMQYYVLFRTDYIPNPGTSWNRCGIGLSHLLAACQALMYHNINAGVTPNTHHFTQRGGTLDTATCVWQSVKTFSPAQFTRDRWLRIVLGWFWSADPNVGRFVIELDGVKFVDARIATLKVGQSGSTPEFGLYRGSRSWNTVAYFDDIQMASTREELGLSPTPPPPSGPPPLTPIGQGDFGRDSTSGSTLKADAILLRVRASKFTLDKKAKITALNIYLSGQTDAIGIDQITPGIWAVSGANPGALLATYEPVTVVAAQPTGFVTSGINTPPELNPGDYYLGFTISGDGVMDLWYEPITGALRFATDDGDATLPDPFPTATSGDLELVIYGTQDTTTSFSKAATLTDTFDTLDTAKWTTVV